MSYVERYDRNLDGRDFAVGEIFGRLRLLGRADIPGAGRTMWSLECDCGSALVRPKSDIISGRTRSCGCLKKELASENSKPDDITGQKFGRLVAVKLAPKIRGQRQKWECMCDCGSTSQAYPGDLKKGTTVSCGCYRSERAARENAKDISGRKFGRLLAIAPVEKGHYGVAWQCACECGERQISLSTDLIGGRVISCGCANIDKPRLTDPSVQSKRNAYGHVRRARKRNAVGRFTAEQISSLFAKQRGRCASCKDKLSNRFHRDHRMPLVLGGSNEIENIELLCSDCNLKKGCKHPDAWANQNGRLL